MARAAWLGYGPGLLVCALTIFITQSLVPRKPHPVALIPFGFLVVILLIISRIAQKKRDSEATLRSAAENSEHMVAVRTLELSRKDERLQEQGQLLDLAPVAILAADPDDVIGIWSRGAELLYGWTAEEAIGKVSYELLKTVPLPLQEIQAKLITTGSWEGEVTHTRRDGTRLKTMSRWAQRRNTSGEVVGSLQVNTDVTERHRIEEQLRQSQKLETVGLLAGGVAHDFNNLLTIINGYAEMLLGDLPPSSSGTRESLVEIRTAGERAAELTRQLLAFGRKQLFQPTVLNVNAVLGDVHKMLRRLIGEDIELVMRLDPSLANVTADPGQLHQVIMNLAVNSRDAMPHGGTLIFETANMTFDESFLAAHPEIRAGKVAMLAVTDTGIGMTPEVRDRLFEPFFTTKPKGTGTGLGLSTVYGLIKQAGGWIWVYSESGHGAVFKIYLPVTDASVSPPDVLSPATLHGSETILIAEDQAEVSRLAQIGLRRQGYRVLAAANANEAIEVSKEFTGVIDLLLTDVVMPGMSGRALADQVLAHRPNLRVLFMSGYTESSITHRGVLDPGVAYLQKPFTHNSLAVKIRETLSC
jgi:PAS domain S-box-containing protein